jgi:glutamate synthase (NADPH/NADH) large chain
MGAGPGRPGQRPRRLPGIDGPLAALDEQVHNLSDYFKEKVAVVTNPAVDREREQEHFSTQSIVGPRPALAGPEGGPVTAYPPHVVLAAPVLAGGHAGAPLLPASDYRALAESHEIARLEDVLAAFPPEQVVTLALVTEPGETVRSAVERLADAAVSAAQGGAALLLLDDAPPDGPQAFADGRGWVNPHLAVARIDRALRAAPDCRRAVGLIVRSPALRNLHDLILALGPGRGRGGAVPAAQKSPSTPRRKWIAPCSRGGSATRSTPCTRAWRKSPARWASTNCAATGASSPASA